jgi:hypothetical protein
MAMRVLAAALVSVASAGRAVRQSEAGDNTEAESEAHGSGSHDAPAQGAGGGATVSLGEILGILSLVCCVLYCIGIGYKIFKIYKGTYVEEEPVFLKYK